MTFRRSREVVEEEMGIDTLDLNQLIDIFCRLPIKTLGQCKCVCKSWKAMIEEDTSLVEIHLTRYNKDHIYPIVFYIKSHRRRQGNLLQETIQKPLLACRRVALTMDHLVSLEVPRVIYFLSFDGDVDVLRPCPFPEEGQKIVGWCNGLICLSRDGYGKPAFVWNPITREQLILPESHVEPATINLILSGIGYDAKTKQYKVVWIQYFRDNLVDGPIGSEGQIHTLGTDSWRKLKDEFDLNQLPNRGGTFAAGALHWIAGSYNDRIGISIGSPERIFSLDMTSEKLSSMPWPDPGPAKDQLHHQLIEWKGCLSITYRAKDCSIEVWVLDNYKGKNKSWTKQLKIGSIDKIDRYVSSPAKYGEILVGNFKEPDCQWFSYDTGRLYPYIRVFGESEIATHVASLVSPKALRATSNPKGSEAGEMKEEGENI